MELIFITSPALSTLAKRFVSDWMMEVDATFNINSLRMPLLVCRGITNTGRTFPFALTFIMSESQGAIDWMFKCLNSLIFNDDWPHPRIVISD